MRNRSFTLKLIRLSFVFFSTASSVFSQDESGPLDPAPEFVRRKEELAHLVVQIERSISVGMDQLSALPEALHTHSSAFTAKEVVVHNAWNQACGGQPHPFTRVRDFFVEFDKLYQASLADLSTDSDEASKKELEILLDERLARRLILLSRKIRELKIRNPAFRSNFEKTLFPFTQGLLIDLCRLSPRASHSLVELAQYPLDPSQKLATAATFLNAASLAEAFSLTERIPDESHRSTVRDRLAEVIPNFWKDAASATIQKDHLIQFLNEIVETHSKQMNWREEDFQNLMARLLFTPAERQIARAQFPETFQFLRD